MSYLTKIELKEKYPKFQGFENISEAKLSFISEYFELSECEKIVFNKGNEPHLDNVTATFTNGKKSKPVLMRQLVRWMRIESGTL